MAKFKIGDRVRHLSFPFKGEIGIIIADPLSNMPGVQFEVNGGEHSCFGRGKKGHCWWCLAGELELDRPKSFINK